MQNASIVKSHIYKKHKLTNMLRALAPLAIRQPTRKQGTKRNMSLVNADSGPLATSFFHKLNTVVMVSTPLACGSLLFGDSMVFKPFEILLGVALPLHAHIGMNYVITDYGKKMLGKSAVGPLRGMMMGITGVTILGLAKVNVMDGGMVSCIKAMWSGSKKKS